MLMKIVEKCAVSRILENEIDMQFVVEKSIEVDYIRVVTERLQFDLFCNLLFHFVLLDGEFTYLLDGHNHPSLPVPKLTLIYLARYT